jgi:hypothetical protein
MRTRALTILAVVLAAAALPAAASAAPGSYILKHPRREHCKARYIRKVKRATVHGKKVRQVWCVSARHKLTRAPTLTFLTVLERGGVLAEQPPYKTVEAAVDTHRSGRGNRLLGIPVTVTFANHATRAILGSFTEASYAAPCTVVQELAGGQWVLKGQAVANHPGCAIATITAPGPQGISVIGSFAGSARYAPSTSKAQLFVGSSSSTRA